jgi:hypothetical protein
MFENQIRESIDSGKNVLLVDDCTNTGATVFSTIIELSENYRIPYDRISFFSFYVNNDLLGYDNSGKNRHCYFNNTTNKFCFRQNTVPSSTFHAVELFNADHIEYTVITDTRLISNQLLKAIHESVAPYVSYMPCFFLERNCQNATLFDEILDTAKEFDYDLINNVGHDFIYRKDMKERFYIIPIANDNEGFRKYIKICTVSDINNNGSGYLYIAPYVYLKDNSVSIDSKSVVAVNHLNALYDMLIGNYFGTYDSVTQKKRYEFKHRRLKHLLSALLFKEFISDFVGHDITDIRELSELGFAVLMTEIFGEFNVFENPESVYAKLINGTSLDDADVAVLKIFGKTERNTEQTNKPPDKNQEDCSIAENLWMKISTELDSSFEHYLDNVGKFI